MVKQNIYLDYAATTPVDPRVVKAMLPYHTDKYGNAASLHTPGRQAHRVLEKSRAVVAGLLKAKSKDIIFTASATESNNLALKGAAWASRKKHIIVSSIEHDCVLNSAAWLAKQGFKVTKLPVNKHGLVDPLDIKKAINKDTILVSVMHANNEIGTIEPIAAIGKICRSAGVYFHTDAAQSFGKLPIDVNRMNVDLLTASSHKMYGPKGAALLYIRPGTEIQPLLHGGGHERKLRSSTVNIAAIAGFARAAELCADEMTKEAKRLAKLRDRLIDGVLKDIPSAHLNGHSTKRLPNNASLRFDFVEGESIVTELDFRGIAASTASACASASLEPSHVLLACGLKHGQAHGAVRFSLGRWTTQRDIDYVLRVLPPIIKKLRKISPFTPLETVRF